MIKVTTGVHRNEQGSQQGSASDISKLVPETTVDEHHQRVEEWTLKSQPAPPSNKKKTARQVENDALEAKSLLVDEAVRLLDHREEILKSRPNTVIEELEEVNNVTNLSPKPEDTELPTVDPNAALMDDDWGLGKRFRESRMSAKNYVKEFEAKIRQKKMMASSMLPGKKNFKSKILAQINKFPSNMPPVVEPDAWRHKASRSVRFTVKPPSTIEQSLFQKENAGNNEASEDDTVDSKWQMKHENDRDWWKWKLKQRFMQNDELLQKLASQRRNLESSFNLVDTRRKRLIMAGAGSQASIASSSNGVSPQPFAQRNSSRHVTVEIAPQHPPPNDFRVISAPTTASKQFKESNAQFFNSIIVRGDGTSASTVATTRQKLKTLKKDPYLAKLLAGREMFKPEMMLDITQSNKRHEVSQQFKANNAGAAPNTNSDTRRKISLESLTDSTDDDFQAAKFFNPDVKILYERMSELEANKFKSKVNNLQSREPSDGFFNLPLLLATGRFNRYNKLPSMKLQNEASTRQTKKFDKFPSRNNKSQSPGKRKAGGSTAQKVGQVGIVAAAAAALAAKDESSKDPTMAGKKIEELTTKEWAKQLMSKMKPQVSNHPAMSKTDTESFVTLSDDDDDDKGKNVDARFYNTDEILDTQRSVKKKYKVPIDQETNMLYHEILMSKWKKEKHDKDLTAGPGFTHGAPQGSLKATKPKLKRGGGGVKRSDINKMERLHSGKPRGLDIWLENIREKAKRDRLIAPLPNHEVQEISKKPAAASQPVVTTYNNAAFNFGD